MKRLITPDDFIETYSKIKQRGIQFIISKFNLNAIKRTHSAFEVDRITSSNWWLIPQVHNRWNYLITGDENTGYEHFLAEKYLKDKSNLKMLSLGSGDCSHELELSKFGMFSEITCVDIVQSLLDSARSSLTADHKAHFNFICSSIYDLKMELASYDVVFFSHSLHHFKNVAHLLEHTIKPILKKDGMLVIHEYVGPDRLQFPHYQINAVNKALKEIPKPLRIRFKRNAIKSKFYGSGLLRMIVADPSECVDSSSILPACRSLFTPIYERGFGGNLTMNVLKDIAHHFIEPSTVSTKALYKLFENEDIYLKSHESDFVFGIYKKK